MRGRFRAALTAAMVASTLCTIPAHGSVTHRGVGETLGRGLAARLARIGPHERTRVFVAMRAQPDMELSGDPMSGAAAVVPALRAQARSAQRDLRAYLRGARRSGSAGRLTPLWIAGGLSVSATPDVIRALASRPEVASIRLDEVTVTPTAAEANITTVTAPSLWAKGDQGQGVTVATLDSGVDVTHPDLSATYRGGSNSWFDPYGQHPSSPVDLTGHGTGTMGVIVGGSAGGSSIGMAPQAKWIAARIWNDAGGSTMTAIHQAFQWLLNPDGNAATDDAPDVVNLSWSLGTAPGCDLSLQPDLQALRAAGILPVVAAGNFGPAANSSTSPANYPEALAVGAVSAADVVWSGSGRGPTTCGGSSGVFPEIVAPGMSIRSTDRFGLYQTITGTSIAAPHVSGAAALLLSSHPGLSPDQLTSALTGSAVDLGSAGPDQTYGNGRLDVAAAEASLTVNPPDPILDLSISANGSQQIGGLPVADEDVVRFDGSAFTMVFDGSDVGVSGELDAYSSLDPDSLLISLASSATLSGVGAVDDSDVVRFDATSFGATTAGTFSMYLDASDVGLSTDPEDLDAVELLPDGRILVSLLGTGSVSGITKVQDEDVLSFVPTSLGSVTAGSFAVYFDGSDVALNTAGSEDVDAVAVATDGRVMVSTLGAFTVAGASGTGDDVFACSPTSLGPATTCSFSSSLLLDGSAHALGGLGVDAVEVS